MPSKLTSALLVCFAWPALQAQIPQPDGGPLEHGDLPVSWRPAGPNCLEVPDWEVHQFNPDLFILRESGCTNYEKPFLYLLFGKQKALLLDTGAGSAKTNDVVSKIIAGWLASNKLTKIPLLVAHTHGHGDHIAGDDQFRGGPETELIEPTVPAVQAAFGIRNWPDSFGSVDLGDRVLDVIAIPGHQDSSIALYDRRTGILFTGDSLYPGRLYVSDWAAFAASTQRLIAFTKGKPISYILGCHIEQSRQPFTDYPVGTVYQPDEHGLALGRAELLELNEALEQAGNTPARIAYRDFTIWPKQRRKSSGPSQ
jgi:hydroxyacylglutathione hydrolase